MRDALQNEDASITVRGDVYNLSDYADVIRGDEIVEWFGRNPDGVVIAYHRSLPDLSPGPFFTQKFRGRTLALWNRDAALADPGLFMR